MYSLTCQCLINDLNLPSWEHSLLWDLKVMVSFFSLPNQSLPLPFSISVDSWPHQPWLPCYCLPISLFSSLPKLNSLSLIVSSLLLAVSLWMSPFHPTLSTVHNFLLQHCEIQNTVIYDLEIIHPGGGGIFLFPSDYSFGQGQLKENDGRESDSVRRSLF